MGRKNRSRSLDKLMDQLFNGLGDSAAADFLEYAPEIKEPSKREIWSDVVDALLDSLPEQMIRTASELGADSSLKYSKVYAKGEIHGAVHNDQFPTNVYIDFGKFETDPPRFGCSDCNLGENQVCAHAVAFMMYVYEELSDARRGLAKRIDRKKWTKGKPDYSDFERSQSELVLRQVSGLAKQLSASAKDDDVDTALPPIETEPEKRIAWNFEIDSYSGLSVEPYLQQRKKRGKGFTKGRKLSLKHVVASVDLPTSEHDRRVIGCIEHDARYYYQDDYSLSPFESMMLLVDQPNVLLDGEPVQIEVGDIDIRLVRRKDEQYYFTSIYQWNGKPASDEEPDVDRQRVFSSDSYVAYVDTDARRMAICQCGDQARTAFETLRKMPPIEPEHAAALVDRLGPIRSLIDIKLPEELSGPVIADPASPVVLLRSRTDGKLDIGIRVKTSTEALRLPGAPPLFSIEKRDGKDVQLLRDGDAERKSTTALMRALGLDFSRSTWFGTIDDFQQALGVIERLQNGELDAEIRWDKTSEKPLKVLGSLTRKNVKVEIATKRNWFAITGDCQFGDESVKLSELLAGLPSGEASNGDYIQLNDGGWAKIESKLKNRLLRLRDATHTERKTMKFDVTAAPEIRDLMEEDVEVKATRAWEKCYSRLAKAENLEPVVPSDLDADLREYQVEGYSWMRRLAEWGVGGVLADDMGLGKTLQTLAVLLDRAKEGPALVIAPTSVGFNWARETERFAPGLDVHLYRETERSEFLPSVGPGSLVICSYGLALRDAEALAKVNWHTMVLDEAQAIKNSRSKTSRAIAEIEADWTVALTGTPVENHLGELWSLFRVVSPGVFGGWDNFRNRFATPIEKMKDEDARESLSTRLQPFVLRRTKSEVLTELPPRTEMNLYVDLSPAERAEYEQVRLAAIGEIEQIESLPDIQDQRFKILALMTRLRQISCHAGMVNANWTESSAKLQQLTETLNSLREEGHRCLIFSQFTKHLGLIRNQLEQLGISFEYLDGSTPPKARQEAVDRFQEGSADAFLISLKAGGTGLNLTAADYVIHMDPWWNPAVEDQATDRAHRFGQDKPVMVYRIVARGTIEEEILALHESKRDLVAGVMKGTQTAAKLTNEDLIKMLRG